MATPAGPELAIAAVQTAQVLTILLGAPGVSGVISRVEARLQGRRGPRILQPRRAARDWLLAVLSDVDTRSCWQLAERAGDRSPHRMQSHRARWPRRCGMPRRCATTCVVVSSTSSRTLLLLRWADPLPGTPLLSRALIAAGRSLLAHRYTRTYRRGAHRCGTWTRGCSSTRRPDYPKASRSKTPC